MQVLVEHISKLFLSYNDFLSKNIKSIDKKSLNSLYDEFSNNNFEQKKSQKKTAYQNFFALKRKTFSESNPEIQFGQISKLISSEWRSMTKVEKDSYKNILENEDDDEKKTSIVFEVDINTDKLKKKQILQLNDILLKILMILIMVKMMKMTIQSIVQFKKMMKR